MLNVLKRTMQRDDVAKLGKHTVKIEKVTPRQYKELFSVIGTLPNLILNVYNAPKEDYHAYLVTAAEVGIEDFVHVVAFLTGIEEDYLLDETSLDEVTDYLVRMMDFNNLEKTVKNLLRLLPKSQ